MLTNGSELLFSLFIFCFCFCFFWGAAPTQVRARVCNVLRRPLREYAYIVMAYVLMAYIVTAYIAYDKMTIYKYNHYI